MVLCRLIKKQSSSCIVLYIIPNLRMFSDFDNVYEPAEDSYILLDALETEIEEIRRLKPTVALEVGPGSGIISAALANLTLNHNSNKKLCFVFSCDVNIAACNATKRTAVQNNAPGNLEVIRCNLMDSIRDRLHQNIDLSTYFIKTKCDIFHD